MQRSSKNEAGEYDLEGVTARLASMEARRRRRKDQQNADAVQQQQQQQGLDRKISCEFDLAPAELSSGGSDSDNDYCSSSTNSLPSDSEGGPRARGSRPKTPKLRVVDSLDLSMSVATFGGEPTSPHQAGPAHIKRGSTNEPSSRLKLPGRRLGKANSGEQIGGNTLRDRSRIPKLVERRRQIQAVGKHANEAMNDRENSSVTASNNKGVNEHSSLSSRTQAKLRYSTQVPTRKPSQTTVEARLKANEHASVNAKSILDDIDSCTAEEWQLLQSLEKLNQRLSHVSTPAVVALESGHQENHSELHASVVHNSRSIGTSKKEGNDNNLRPAAYGGGTHCKLRQPSSASLRSSFVKRAELSEGIHKARVRVGGATVHDGGRRSSADGAGKHKIVVKKDLAHLLF